MKVNNVPRPKTSTISDIAVYDTMPSEVIRLVKLPLDVRSSVPNRHYLTTDVTGGVSGVIQTIAAQQVTTTL